MAYNHIFGRFSRKLTPGWSLNTEPIGKLNLGELLNNQLPCFLYIINLNMEELTGMIPSAYIIELKFRF